MSEKTSLYILWTSESKITAEKMVFMYGINAKLKGWWEKVTIILWGAPVLLVGDDRNLQMKVEEAQLHGVHISACRACAEQLGAVKSLENLGIEVIYWGAPLTKILKEDEALLTV